MISPRENDEFTLFHVLMMMVVDSLLYFILAWYIENVHPGWLLSGFLKFIVIK